MGHSVNWKNMIQLDFFVALCVAYTHGFAPNDRVIDDTSINVKVIAGTTAVLPCSVNPQYTESYGDQYKVVWVNPTDTAISLEDRRMINDMRISIERPFLTDWNLHIRNVTVADAGVYKCQINTDPVKTKRVKLIIQVPPKLTSYTIPDDVKVRVGDNVELMCNATGNPPPTIKWYRLNKAGTGIKERVGSEGEILRIYNISRMCADIYKCVANNSVPPERSREIKVTVEYPPEIRLPNSRIGQELGKETILECIITASPLGVTEWKKDGVQLSTTWKYEVDLYTDGPNTITLSLRIGYINESDFGEYICEASNSQGRTYAKMMLYEVKPITTTKTTTTKSPRRRPEVKENSSDRENDDSDAKKYDPWHNSNGIYTENNSKGRNRKPDTNWPGRKRPPIPPTENVQGTPTVLKPGGGAHLTGVFGTGSMKSSRAVGLYIPSVIIIQVIISTLTLLLTS